MLVEYGSDNDSDSDNETLHQPSSSKSKSSPLPSSQKSDLLPHSPNGNSFGSKLSKTLPASKSKRPAKRITIDLPSVLKDDADDLDGTRPAKKARVDTKGAGSSTLFSMLPAPKQKLPEAPVPQRVLGGGGRPGLVFNTSRDQSTAGLGAEGGNLEDNDVTADPTLQDTTPLPSRSFIPPSLTRNKANISLEDPDTRTTRQHTSKPPPPAAPAVDFFSLDISPSPSSSRSNITSLPKVSSAPKVEDYVPPEPSPTDEYPGYYRLPSGSWAAYEPGYYQRFYTKWKAEYDAQVRALEKGLERGFEGADADETQEVNAHKEMERAKREIQEREEKKALTQDSGVPAAPKMNIKGSKLGKGARTRHQLTTLLADAYENRDALEAKIAEGRRNRKEAGNKYGF
ncbi:mitotic checkpoint regulator, MAD2B-interacting-domain-containing protein [Amylostereum chailletii]|nr:mitotic checkpoint regulator, MAD2B-interacting-domain-containing protein [Amylostereum chailletii]